MKKDSVTKTNTQMMQETIKIGKTVYTINHSFAPNQTKQDTWMSIITRAEGMKSVKN